MKTELQQRSLIAGRRVVHKGKKPIPFEKDEASSEEVRADGKVVSHKSPSGDKPPKYQSHERSRTMAEELAGNQVCYVHHMWDGGREAFKYHPKLQVVSKYFPFAKGGPLYVDEPRWPHEIDDCKKKLLAMKEQGKRYLMILSDMTLEQARKELDRCGQRQSQISGPISATVHKTRSRIGSRSSASRTART